MAPKKPGVPMTPDPTAVGGFRQQTTDARDSKSYLWAARIVHVDIETMVCSIRLGTGYGEYHDVPIPAPGGGGPRSWSGSVPETGTQVIIGWKKLGTRSFKPYIIEFLTSGVFMSRDFEPFASMDPTDAAAALEEIPDMDNDPGINFGTVRLKLRKAYSGDFLASSASGSDIILDRDSFMTNRAGNEFRLRDSDQTTILQTINEYTNNAAGYYKRGLIKRNAYSFLPDLYPYNDDGSIPTTIPTTSPAYSTLLNFGLIDEQGNKTFPDNPTEPFYPYIVTPDGQHVAYVVHGEHESDFVDAATAYIEDRSELRHISDGIMTVTEEGDGFQVDPPFPTFIEDVKGTVVGNDFHSEAGRPLYKRVLRMRIFSDPDQRTPSFGPTFEAVDTIQDLGIMDDVALARLFKIQSPNGSNQYAFGVSKEGRVFLHIPKSLVGTPDDKGKSVDLNIQGLVKAVLGADENSGNKSLDLRMTGGVNIDVGRFTDGKSMNLTLRGKVRVVHMGNDANGLTREEVYGGSTSRSVSASEMAVVGGSSIENIGAQKAVAANSIILNAGGGGLKQLVAGDNGLTVLGKTTQQYAQLKTTTLALGNKTTILLGVDDKTILAGSKTTTMIAGSLTETVVTGSVSRTVATGNMSSSVAAGAWSATVGSGSLALSCGAGPISMTSSLTNTLTAGVMNSLSASLNKIGIPAVGFAVAGVPGPPGPHLDFVTGLPIFGLPTIIVG